MKERQRHIAIRVQALSKRYDKESSRAELKHVFTNLFRKKVSQYFWALKDISFEVNRGEIIGIIGENGSGKSTLLKILSGITKPTAGRVEIYGQIASILDIGAGFHPELSGKENIYLKGQLLGMSSKEITRHFDQIVAFSEIGDFIHMPIKHYSDGMFLRLAFASLIHLHADILLLDEVLAVGDLRFQQKCISKILEMKEAGKTILVVSHNARELMEICTGYILLQQGQLINFASDISVLSGYIQNTVLSDLTVNEAKPEQTGNFEKSWKNLMEAPGCTHFKLKRIRIKPNNCEASNAQLYTDQELAISLQYFKSNDEGTINLFFSINDAYGNAVMACYPRLPQHFFAEKASGDYSCRCILPDHLFNKGVFRLNIFGVKNGSELIFTYRDALIFEVDSRSSTPCLTPELQQIPTPLAPVLDWEIAFEPAKASMPV